MYQTVQGTASVLYSKYKLKKSVIDFYGFADFLPNWDFSRIFSPLISLGGILIESEKSSIAALWVAC
jgi:hypothetical protein